MYLDLERFVLSLTAKGSWSRQMMHRSSGAPSCTSTVPYNLASSTQLTLLQVPRGSVIGKKAEVCCASTPLNEACSVKMYSKRKSYTGNTHSSRVEQHLQALYSTTLMVKRLLCH